MGTTMNKAPEQASFLSICGVSPVMGLQCCTLGVLCTTVFVSGSVAVRQVQDRRAILAVWRLGHVAD